MRSMPAPEPISPRPPLFAEGNTKARCLVDLVYEEAHRNERRINSVKMVLVALGIAMSLGFWLHAGARATAVTVAQGSVLSAWLLAMAGVALVVRRPLMPRAVPYTVLTLDNVMVALLVAVRMLYLPEGNQAPDGVLSDWTYLMIFPILASAGPRFDRDVARYAELLAVICTLGLLVFGLVVLGHQPRAFFVIITLVCLTATGRFSVMVTDRGRGLVDAAARLGLELSRPDRSRRL